MQKRLLLVPILAWGCGGGSDSSPVDTVAAPAALTSADATGSFTARSMAETSDSVLASFTYSVALGASGALEGKMVNLAAPADTVAFTQVLSGDSAVSESAPYTDPAAPKGSGQFHWKAVGRATGGDWAGTVAIMPAGSDSVVQRARWKATRTP